MANDMMEQMVTDRKIRELEAALADLNELLDTYRISDRTLRLENKSLKDAARRAASNHREVVESLKEAMADYEESTGCRDARWYQQARFVLEM